jgi:hypothetical protein
MNNDAKGAAISLADLAALGITPDVLVEKLADRLANELSECYVEVEEEDGFVSKVQRRRDEKIKAAIDAAVDAAAARFVAPNIAERIESVVLEKTNQWGERSGEAPVPFIEYLVQRADHYMTEPVNHAGKTRAEDSYSWTKSTTRIAYMIDAHLQYSISNAMKQALATANSSIVKGIEDAVKIKLAELQAQLKVEVKTR